MAAAWAPISRRGGASVRQPRCQVRGEFEVAKADQRQVLRHPQAGGLCPEQGPAAQVVVGETRGRGLQL